MFSLVLFTAVWRALATIQQMVAFTLDSGKRKLYKNGRKIWVIAQLVARSFQCHSWAFIRVLLPNARTRLSDFARLPRCSHRHFYQGRNPALVQRHDHSQCTQISQHRMSLPLSSVHPFVSIVNIVNKYTFIDALAWPIYLPNQHLKHSCTYGYDGSKQHTFDQICRQKPVQQQQKHEFSTASR